jgi:exosortase
MIELPVIALCYGGLVARKGMGVYVNQAEGQTDLRPALSWRQVSPVVWVRAAILALLFLLLFRHELHRIVRQWMTDPSWSHGFLIPLFSLYFVHQRREAILSGAFRSCLPAVVLVVASIGFYFFNLVSPAGYAYLGALAMVVTLAGVIWVMGGHRLLLLTWLPVLYLIFAIPLPRRLYVAVTMPLREWAAFVAAALLDLAASVEASVQGVVIEILYQGERLSPALNVAEACSGMRLLMAFLALGVAMAYLHDRPLWQRWILLLSTVPIAVACNIVRVSATGFLYVFIHPRYTQGIFHDALGLAMLPLAFALNGFLAWFMSSLFVEDEDELLDAPVEHVIRRATPVSPVGANHGHD